MKNLLIQFLKQEQGQDLIEYTLLMAFLVLGSAALFAHAGSSVNNVWKSANTVLANAAAVASS